MGGGTSKNTKTETIKPTAQGQISLQEQASNSPKKQPSKAPGPQSKPQLTSEGANTHNSPVKMQGRVTSKPLNPHQLAHNPSEDEEGMGLQHETPGSLAKKSKQAQQARGAVRGPQQYPSMQASPAQSSSKSPQKTDALAAKKEADAQRQKKQEDDKLRQLQAIKEQQKAKQAAAAASAAISQKREPTIGSMRNETNGEEVFAAHSSPKKGNGLGYSYNKFSGGLDESEASGDFRNMDMQIQGNGLMKKDQSRDYMQSSGVPAPATIGFKVISYGGAQKDHREVQYAQNGTMAVKSSGIHMGMMEDQNKDDQQNRNIDMAELNELLGM